MIKNLYQLCLVFVLLQSGHYVNMARVDYIDTKEKWIKIGNHTHRARDHWFLKITDEDIKLLKRAMNYSPGIMTSND
jgi:hypothetical protein